MWDRSARRPEEINNAVAADGNFAADVKIASIPKAVCGYFNAPKPVMVSGLLKAGRCANLKKMASTTKTPAKQR